MEGTDKLKGVFRLANAEATRLKHEYIGTEHLLLGLIKSPEPGVGYRVLEEIDFDFDGALEDLAKFVQPGVGLDVVMGMKPQTPRAKKVQEYGIDFAREIGHNYLGTEHLLYGLVREQEGVAAQVLLNKGIKDFDEIRENIMQYLRIGNKDEVDVKRVPLPQKIPKEGVNLREFLEERGFGYREVADPDGSIFMIELGERLVGKHIPEYDQIMVLYDPNNAPQISEALNLRRFFDLNSVDYQEEPPAECVSEVLRQRCKGLVEIIKGLKKK